MAFQNECPRMASTIATDIDLGGIIPEVKGEIDVVDDPSLNKLVDFGEFSISNWLNILPELSSNSQGELGLTESVLFFSRIELKDISELS